MRGRVALLAVVATLCLDVSGAGAAPRWIRLRTANFTFVSDASNAEVADVARHLEQFRQVLSLTVPRARLTPPTPMTIVVFARQRDLDRVRPLFEGKPIEVPGYFTYGPDGAAIAMSLERAEQAYATIYHEFTHMMVDNSLTVVPVWFGEGIAEYYGTFYLKADGRHAQVGRAANYRLAELQTSFIPLDQLLSAGRDSPLYQTGSRRGAFYAESWALVHYLLLGNPARTPQLYDYLARLAIGTPWSAAFQEAFGTTPELLGREVADYVRRPAFPLVEYASDNLAIDNTPTVESMTEAEAEATVANLFLLLRRFGEAEERLKAALSLDPKTAWAHTVLGLLRLRQGRVDDALPPLRRGAELAPSDAMAQYGLGYGAIKCYSSEPSCAAGKAPLEVARTALLKAVELVPDFPTALSFLGFVEMIGPGQIADAERHLLRATELAPSREDYRIHLAQVYLRQREYAKAQALLGPLSAYAAHADNRDVARQLLGELARLKNAETLAARMAEVLVPPPPPGGAGSAAAAGGDDPNRKTSRLVPVFRQLGPSDQRIEGVFEAVECSGQTVVIRIRDKERVRRFWAPRFGAVEFITYRDETPGNVPCGPQTPAPKVYLTWRAPATGDPKLDAGVEGIAVAVEILPK
jgi:tetratricopeptide (TPR) repeat protein